MYDKVESILSGKIKELVNDLRAAESVDENKRVKSMVISKLQEALLLSEHIYDKDF